MASRHLHGRELMPFETAYWISQMGRFETEILVTDENLVTLGYISGIWISIGSGHHAASSTTTPPGSYFMPERTISTTSCEDLVLPEGADL